MYARLLVATALAALIAVPASAQVKKSEMPGIRNYSRVDATVGCGGAVDPSAMSALKKEGFVSVINLRLASEQGADIDAGRAAAQAAGLKYIHLPFNVAMPDPRSSMRSWRRLPTRAISRSSFTAGRRTASAGCG